MRFTNRIILILWAIGTGQFAACSDGGTEAPGPENGTQTIVWTPAVPVRDAAVVFSLEGSPDNVRSVLWMFGDGATATSGAGESAEPLPTGRPAPTRSGRPSPGCMAR